MLYFFAAMRSREDLETEDLETKGFKTEHFKTEHFETEDSIIKGSRKQVFDFRIVLKTFKVFLNCNNIKLMTVAQCWKVKTLPSFGYKWHFD